MFEKLAIALFGFPALTAVYSFFIGVFLLRVGKHLPETETSATALKVVQFGLAAFFAFRQCRSMWPAADAPPVDGDPPRELEVVQHIRPRLLYAERQQLDEGAYAAVAHAFRNRWLVRLVIGIAGICWFGFVAWAHHPEPLMWVYLLGIGTAVAFDAGDSLRAVETLRMLEPDGDRADPAVQAHALLAGKLYYAEKRMVEDGDFDGAARGVRRRWLVRLTVGAAFALFYGSSGLWTADEDPDSALAGLVIGAVIALACAFDAWKSTRALGALTQLRAGGGPATAEAA